MGIFLALTALAVTACFILLTLAVVGFVIKTLFWIVFFPIRLVLKLVFWILGAGLSMLVLPLVLLVGGIAVIGAIIAMILSLLAPLLPVAIVALVGWGIYRASTNLRTGETF